MYDFYKTPVVPGDPKHFSEVVEAAECLVSFPKALKNSKSHRIILSKVTKLTDLPECPKYFWDFPQAVEKFYKPHNNSKWS